MVKNFLERIKYRLLRSKSSKTDNYQIYTAKIRELENLFGFKIRQTDFFLKAITHRSYLEILPEMNKSNERLEYLGDSVLSLVVGEYLFSTFPDEEEGFLTKARSHLVNKESLSEAAARIKLGKYLFYDKRYINSSPKGLRTISADALEALIGAVYLDQGIESAKEFIYKWIIRPNQLSGRLETDSNYKGQLLEYTHANNLANPNYDLVKEEGPEHSKLFTIEVFIGKESFGIGTGKNKKSAEQKAAKDAIIKLRKKHQIPLD